MSGQPITVYDSGKLPLWVRIPLATVGLCLLVLGVDLLVWHLFGVHFLAFLKPVPQSLGVTILAVCVFFVLGLVLCNTWVARRRIVVEPEERVLLELDWLGGTLRRSVPLPRLRAIEVEQRRRGKGGGWCWQVNARLEDDGLLYLREMGDEQEAEAFAGRLSGVVGVPVGQG